MCETVCMCVSLYAFYFARMSLFLTDSVCVCGWLAVLINVTFKGTCYIPRLLPLKVTCHVHPDNFLMFSLVKLSFSVRASDSQFLLGARTGLPK